MSAMHNGNGHPLDSEFTPPSLGQSAHGVLPPFTGQGSLAAGAAPLQAPRGTLDGLRQRRLELAERVAALTWDLGGLTYEMAVRDHYRLDVLARRAAELQEADAQLGEVERLLAATEAGVHGQCRACGSVHSRGAAYCWHCGVALLSELRPSVLPGDPAVAGTADSGTGAHGTGEHRAGEHGNDRRVTGP